MLHSQDTIVVEVALPPRELRQYIVNLPTGEPFSVTAATWGEFLQELANKGVADCADDQWAACYKAMDGRIVIKGTDQELMDELSRLAHYDLILDRLMPALRS